MAENIDIEYTDIIPERPHDHSPIEEDCSQALDHMTHT